MRRAIFSLLTLGAICLCSPAVSQQAKPNGGADFYHLANSANTTNATLIKGSIGNVYAIIAINTTTTVYWLKMYDLSVAPSCNTTPVKLSAPIPYGASNAGGGFVFPIPAGAQFYSGIGFCLTANAADNDNTAAATGITMTVIYK